MNLIARLIATGLFTGYAPVAPGTFGSLVGLLLFWLLPESESPLFIFVILLLLFLGTWAAERVEKQTGIQDAQIIVIDEIVGMLITLFLFEKTFIWLAIGFILFRLFDIVKPVPVKKAESLPGGWGVMMDDVVAGIYAALTLRLIFYFWK